MKRERIGLFSLEQAKTLGEIETLAAAGNALQAVIPIEMLLPEYAKMIVNPAGRRCICNGMALKASDVLKIFPAANTDYFRIFDDEGKLLAIARERTAGHELQALPGHTSRRSRVGQVISTKFQIPNSKQISIFKFQ